MRGLALIALLSVMADPAIAGQAVTLRADITDADGIVTLSDLFEVTGPAGKTVLATRAGASIVLDAGAVQASANVQAWTGPIAKACAGSSLSLALMAQTPASRPGQMSRF